MLAGEETSCSEQQPNSTEETRCSEQQPNSTEASCSEQQPNSTEALFWGGWFLVSSTPVWAAAW